MITVLVILTAFFILIGFLQFQLLKEVLQSGPSLKIESFLGQTEIKDDMTPKDRLESTQWNHLVMLELHLLQQRYHQAKLYIISRIWMRFLGFIIGMTLALIGAAFILGKLKETGTSIDVESANVKLTLLSTSPGIVLSLLGSILMIIAMLSSANIYTEDNATYTAKWSVPVTKIIEERIPVKNQGGRARQHLLDQEN